MSMHGADADQLDQLANLLNQKAKELDHAHILLGRQLYSAPWVGNSADRFRSTWSGLHRRQVGGAADHLRNGARVLAENARQQRQASSAGSGLIGSRNLIRSGSKDKGPRDPFQDQYDAARKDMKSDLEAAKDRLADLKKRLKKTGGFGNFIAEYNPADKGAAEELRDQIKDEERKIQRLEGLLKDPNRQFLKVDVNGSGRIIEVKGNLATAKNVVIHIPGIDNDIDKYVPSEDKKDSNGHVDAHALYSQLKADGESNAVISFLDFDEPGGLIEKGGLKNLWDASQSDKAEVGAANLGKLVDSLHAKGITTEQITVVAHSYGSVVTGLALADGLEVGKAVVVGSPGLGPGVTDISELNTSAEVWAGKSRGVPLFGDGDYVSIAPAHGEDPTDS